MKNTIEVKIVARLLLASTLFCLMLANLMHVQSLRAEVPAAAKDGQVQIPLPDYTQLTEQIRLASDRTQHAVMGFAFGVAKAEVTVEQNKASSIASVNLELVIKVLSDNWQLIPLLPLGTSLESVTVNGSQAELSKTIDGLAWNVKGAGVYNLNLRYRSELRKTEKGLSIAIPMPQASSIALRATIPGAGLDVAVIPASTTELKTEGENTIVQASLAAVSAVQISWHTAEKTGLVVSRAQYSGKLLENAVEWSASFQAENFSDELVNLSLLPSQVTVTDVRLDGKPVSVLVEQGFFKTAIKGKGLHKVEVDFQTAVEKSNGPSKVDLPLAQIPVSRIDLVLPGKKELKIQPESHVAYKYSDKDTTATTFVPLSNNAALSWTEAVPEDEKQELRMSASAYHAVYAEEGVLYVRALVEFEVSRGETSVLELEVPKGVDISKVSTPQGGLTDWRLTRSAGKEPDIVSMFLDRKLQGNLLVEVSYDRSLAEAGKEAQVEVPLLKAKGVHRSRGMVALLSSKELTLKPSDEKQLIRVGENQLPAVVREGIKMTVAHTFKYSDSLPTLVVQATAPERSQGRFDAAVNTLVSLSDVTLKASASVELNVKSGVIADLILQLPLKTNVLSLTAPSLRTYKINADDKNQTIDVQFTQDMEGQLRVEVQYEQILEDNKQELKVPTLSVKGAEVEQGKIGIEALSAVEVQPAAVTALSLLDPGELPQQLVLKTSNPILLGYKYVRADPPHELGLKITRHKEIEVKTATIDRAFYKTLYTKDGIAITAAQFLVRNVGKQFLRVRLPQGAKVWSASVNGQAEKPALAESNKELAGASSIRNGPEVLLKIVNSAQGFTVELLYETPVSKLGNWGRVEGYLPRPDMVVTSSSWDVYLPQDLSYGEPVTNMELKSTGRLLSAQVMRDELKQVSASNSPQSGQLFIALPNAGVTYSFEKLYANQSEEDAFFRLPYAAGFGRIFAILAVAISSALIWMAIAAYLGRVPGLNRRNASYIGLLGLILLYGCVGFYGMNVWPAGVVSVISGFLLIAAHRQQQHEHEFVAVESEPPAHE